MEINAQKAREKAESLYPLEQWLEIEARIFIAESRQPWNSNQKKVLEKELIQARILADLGSVIYLLPERGNAEKHPDAIVDGFLMEFKTITGGIREVERRFKNSREKADNVFLKIDKPLEVTAVKRKLAMVSSLKGYTHGAVIIYFTAYTIIGILQT